MNIKNLSKQDKKTLGILAGLYFITAWVFSNDIGVIAVLGYVFWKRADIKKPLSIYIASVVFAVELFMYTFIYSFGFSFDLVSFFFDALMALLPAGFTYLALWVLFKVLEKKPKKK